MGFRGTRTFPILTYNLLHVLYISAASFSTCFLCFGSMYFFVLFVWKWKRNYLALGISVLSLEHVNRDGLLSMAELIRYYKEA
jgi:hypothetical protein